MSKPWGGAGSIGSWAAEAELAEAEELQAATTSANPTLFPILKDAVTSTKPKKKKMTLSEFSSYSSQSAGPTLNPTRFTPDEMVHLPTGPTLRSPDDYSSGPRLGGGFSTYAGGPERRPRRGGRDVDYDSAPPPPSRADEVDNWASMKRTVPNAGPERGRNPSSRYGELGAGSRGEGVDNWNMGKRAPAPAPAQDRSSTFGSGFRDSVSNRRLGDSKIGNGENVGVVREVNKANPFGAARPREEVLAEKGVDWKKVDLDIEAKRVSNSSRPTSEEGSRPTSSQSNRSESEVRPRQKVNPFGDAKPREVLLEEKGLDWRKIDLDLEHRRVDRLETEEEKALKKEIENLKKDLVKESSNDVPEGSGAEQSSLPELIQIKERELETLIRELDDKLRFSQKAVERPGSGAGRPGSGAGRPGSGAGRYPNFSDRPPPQSGSFDGRGAETMDRPRSRGTVDVWSRPGEDRRGFRGRDGGFEGGRGGGYRGGRGGGFRGGRGRGYGGGRDGGFQGRRDGGFQSSRDGGIQGGRDRGFLSNRDFNRSNSRERW